jgi:exodeoxyribonuclease-3
MELLFSREVHRPIVTRRRLPGDPADHQARYIEAAVEGLLIACPYLPNGKSATGAKVRLQDEVVFAPCSPCG